MKLIDAQYTQHPFFGVEQMTTWLRRQGLWVNKKRTRRLMRLMGICAVYPKPRLSQPNKEDKKFPYLLRNVVIDHPNQVWASDITYIRMHHGFVFLTVIMDWYSRYVISWELSISMEADFCVAALQRALSESQPQIFNTDQGPQFTSDAFVEVLEERDIDISMDGRRRVFDNIFVERLWRTVKYEEVFLHDYSSVQEARKMLWDYFVFYNTERPHNALNGNTPFETYFNCHSFPKSGYYHGA